MAFVPSTASETERWLLRFHEANDSLDVTKLPSIYAKDARIQFGNSPAILGLDAAKTHFESHWSGLEMMHHEIHEFDRVGADKIYQSCRIRFQAKNDPEKERVDVPAMAVLHLVTSGEETGLIRQAEYYLDASPLVTAFSRAG